MAVNGLSRNGMTPHNELCEMKSYTPMLHKNTPTDVEVDFVRVFFEIEIFLFFLGVANWFCCVS